MDIRREWQKGRITKEHKETLGNDGYVHSLECGDHFMGAYIFKTYQTVYFKHMQSIVCQLYQ